MAVTDFRAVEDALLGSRLDVVDIVDCGGVRRRVLQEEEEEALKQE